MQRPRPPPRLATRPPPRGQVRPPSNIIWVEVPTPNPGPRDDPTYFAAFKYPSFRPMRGITSRWRYNIPLTDRVVYLQEPNTWREVVNDRLGLTMGQEPTFFKKLDSSGRLAHPSTPNRIVYRKADIPPGDRVIWLDADMNAMQARVDKRLREDQELAAKNTEEISKEIRRLKTDSTYSAIRRPLSSVGSIIATAMSPLLPASQVFTQETDLIVSPSKKPQFKVSDLGIPKPAIELTPADVEVTQVNPKLKVMGGPLQFFLPHVSHKFKEDFLRWGKRSPTGQILFDPEQNLNKKVSEFVFNKAQFPFIEITYGDNTSISIQKQAVAGVTPPPVKLEVIGPNSTAGLNQIGNFIRTTPYFVMSYPAVPNGETTFAGHTVLVHVNGNEITITDPNGQAWLDPSRLITESAKIRIYLALSAAGITNVVDATCRFQTFRGTCMLWTTFFALFQDRSADQLLKMIDDVIKFVKLPQTPESRDLVIMEIMYEFIQRPVLSTNVDRAEQMAGFGNLRGKAMPEGLIPLQQMAKESYNLVDPKKEINGWELKRWSPTLKFYGKGNEVIIAVRGTKANAPDGSLDVSADLTIPFNGIPGTIRYKRDKAMVENFQKEYPPSQYAYYAVGHSLGGAVIDSLIRDRLIREAVSYNPAIQFSDINRGLPNRRIYYGSDPLYKLMGWWDVKSEHREPENRTWADFLSGVSLPAAAMAALPAHNLSNFEGGRRVSFT